MNVLSSSLKTMNHHLSIPINDELGYTSASASGSETDKSAKKPKRVRTEKPKTVKEALHQQVERLFERVDKPIHIPSKPKEKTLRPPKEILRNTPGSSAGAGSGEFHTYRAGRRRELERIRLMEEKAKKEEDQEEYQQKLETLRKQDEERLAKNRSKRQKRQRKRKTTKGSQQAESGNADNDDERRSDQSSDEEELHTSKNTINKPIDEGQNKTPEATDLKQDVVQLTAPHPSVQETPQVLPTVDSATRVDVKVAVRKPEQTIKVVDEDIDF